MCGQLVEATTSLRQIAIIPNALRSDSSESPHFAGFSLIVAGRFRAMPASVILRMSFLALAMQKYLDDLSCEAGVAPEWKELLRDLDRLQVRLQYRGADWMVRTDAARTIAALFRQAHVALPPRARQTAPRRSPRPPQNPPQNAEAAPSIVPRRLESRRKLMKIRGLLKLGV
jgi:hypothetical protein